MVGKLNDIKVEAIVKNMEDGIVTSIEYGGDRYFLEVADPQGLEREKELKKNLLRIKNAEEEVTSYRSTADEIADKKDFRGREPLILKFLREYEGTSFSMDDFINHCKITINVPRTINTANKYIIKLIADNKIQQIGPKTFRLLNREGI